MHRKKSKDRTNIETSNLSRGGTFLNRREEYGCNYSYQSLKPDLFVAPAIAEPELIDSSSTATGKYIVASTCITSKTTTKITTKIIRTTNYLLIIGSLILSAESSEEAERTDLTPAKRRGTTIVNLEEAVDQNSVTRTPWCDLASRFTNNITVIWRYIKVCTVLQDVFRKCMSSEHHVRGLS
ncbi:hypothetical protein YC2023_042134 [Brassica napus]